MRHIPSSTMGAGAVCATFPLLTMGEREAVCATFPSHPWEQEAVCATFPPLTPWVYPPERYIHQGIPT